MRRIYAQYHKGDNKSNEVALPKERLLQTPVTGSLFRNRNLDFSKFLKNLDIVSIYASEERKVGERFVVTTFLSQPTRGLLYGEEADLERNT